MPSDDQLKLKSSQTKAHPRARVMELSKRFPANIISAHSGRTPEYAKLLTDARFCLAGSYVNNRQYQPASNRLFLSFTANKKHVRISLGKPSS